MVASRETSETYSAPSRAPARNAVKHEGCTSRVAALDSFRHRLLKPRTIAIWFIRAAIVYLVSFPLLLCAIQLQERLESAPPPAVVAFFLSLIIAKTSLLMLLGRALDRCKPVSH